MEAKTPKGAVINRSCATARGAGDRLAVSWCNSARYRLCAAPPSLSLSSFSANFGQLNHDRNQGPHYFFARLRSSFIFIFKALPIGFPAYLAR